jgi:phosphonate transport system substrate-binding protein
MTQIYWSITMKLRHFLSALSLSLISPVVLGATFTFTAIPDEDESQLRTRFDKVAAYLETELGVDVKYVPVKSYSAAVSAFRTNQVQLAWFGGLSGVQARRLVPGSEAIAQGFEDQFFKSYIIAHHSTGLNATEKLGELNGYTLTFGSKDSTSGRLMPQYFLEQSTQQKLDKVFKRIGFSGDHSRTISQVEAGVYQLGAVNYKVWDSAVEQAQVDTSKVSVIWQSPSYPDYQWTVRAGTDAQFGQGFKAKLTAALLNMQDKALLESFPRASFVKASNSDYQPIEDVAIAIGLLD